MVTPDVLPTEPPRGAGHRRGLVVALVALVVVVVAAVAVLKATGPERQHRSCHPAPSGSSSVAGKGALVLPVNPTALIFGDSYTVGWGGTTPTEGYAYKVGSPLGWQVTVDGVSSTGYLNPGRNRSGNYIQRLSDAPAGSFDVVVLQGGSNDVKFPVGRLGPAVDAMVRATRLRYPQAQIVLMGPVFLYAKPTVGYLAVNDVLHGYAAQHRLVYLDPIAEKWFGAGDAARYVNPANGHPDNLGYTRISERFVEDVRAQLSTSPQTC